MDVKRLRRELKDDVTIERCAREFGVVGDATRLKICYLLSCHPELSVGEIAKVLGLSISAVSHSLKKLRDLDLVRKRRQFKQARYRLCPTPLTKHIRGRLASGRT